MKKALILSYVALVAVVLLTPGLGRSQSRVTLRHLDLDAQRIVLSDGQVVSLRDDLRDVGRSFRLRNDGFANRPLRDLRELRNLRELGRLGRLARPEVRVYPFSRSERLDDLRLERLDRLNDLRLDRLDRLNDLRLDRLDRLHDLNLQRLDRLNDLRLDRLDRLNRLDRIRRVWREEIF